MPPIKRRREPRTEDEVTGKKVKMSPTLNLPSEVSKDADGNDYWKLEGTKRVVISEFKGQQMISIREYYEKDGQALPGKKGISLLVKQFSTFISLLPQIETKLHERGEVVSRPIYRYMPPDEKDPHKDEKTPSDSQMGKQNFEETSDED